MYEYALINLKDGHVMTRGEAHTPRLALDDMAKFVLMAVPHNWRIHIERRQYGFDVIHRIPHKRKEWIERPAMQAIVLDFVPQPTSGQSKAHHIL